MRSANVKSLKRGPKKANNYKNLGIFWHITGLKEKIKKIQMDKKEAVTCEENNELMLVAKSNVAIDLVGKIHRYRTEQRKKCWFLLNKELEE